MVNNACLTERDHIGYRRFLYHLYKLVQKFEDLCLAVLQILASAQLAITQHARLTRHPSLHQQVILCCFRNISTWRQRCPGQRQQAPPCCRMSADSSPCTATGTANQALTKASKTTCQLYEQPAVIDRGGSGQAAAIARTAAVRCATAQHESCS